MQLPPENERIWLKCLLIGQIPGGLPRGWALLQLPARKLWHHINKKNFDKHTTLSSMTTHEIKMCMFEPESNPEYQSELHGEHNGDYSRTSLFRKYAQYLLVLSGCRSKKWIRSVLFCMNVLTQSTVSLPSPNTVTMMFSTNICSYV